MGTPLIVVVIVAFDAAAVVVVVVLSTPRGVVDVLQGALELTIPAILEPVSESEKAKEERENEREMTSNVKSYVDGCFSRDLRSEQLCSGRRQLCV